MRREISKKSGAGKPGAGKPGARRGSRLQVASSRLQVPSFIVPSVEPYRNKKSEGFPSAWIIFNSFYRADLIDWRADLQPATSSLLRCRLQQLHSRLSQVLDQNRLVFFCVYISAIGFEEFFHQRSPIAVGWHYDTELFSSLIANGMTFYRLF